MCGLIRYNNNDQHTKGDRLARKQIQPLPLKLGPHFLTGVTTIYVVGLAQELHLQHLPACSVLQQVGMYVSFVSLVACPSPSWTEEIILMPFILKRCAPTGKQSSGLPHSLQY